MNIIITGASKGIGFAIAKMFAMQGEGHNIGICSRTENTITMAAATLRALNSKNIYYARRCDVSLETDVKEFVSGFEQSHGAVDVLINNAGFGIFKPVVEMAKQEFDSILATNLRGVFLMSKAVLPSMRAKRSGTIITISSLAGKHGFKGGSAYCASKFAVRGLMQCLFLEVRTDDIRVVTIFPGTVDTDFFPRADNGAVGSSKGAVSAEDVASCVELTVRLPQNVDVTELEVRPTNPKG